MPDPNDPTYTDQQLANAWYAYSLEKSGRDVPSAQAATGDIMSKIQRGEMPRRLPSAQNFIADSRAETLLPPPPAPVIQYQSLSNSVQITGISKDAAFKIGFYGVFGILSAYLIIAAVLGVLFVLLLILGIGSALGGHPTPTLTP
jgi:hypothetical protein